MKSPRLFATLLAAFAPLALACHDVHLDFSKADSTTIALFDDLYSISVVDDEYAVAVGYYGAAYYTEDGGNSWKKGKTGTLERLRTGWVRSPTRVRAVTMPALSCCRPRTFVNQLERRLRRFVQRPTPRVPV